MTEFCLLYICTYVLFRKKLQQIKILDQRNMEVYTQFLSLEKHAYCKGAVDYISVTVDTDTDKM